jgi:hypothetical protein
MLLLVGARASPDAAGDDPRARRQPERTVSDAQAAPELVA